MRLFIMVVLALAALSGCRTAASQPGTYVGEGVASYYGEGFHGRLTASGERFDRGAMTAAHRSLRFGTCLVVENTRTRRQVEVRVNDRGPFAKRRVIDLSEAAARELDMLDSGTAMVRLYRCQR